MGEHKAKGTFMSALNIAYNNLYDHRALARICVRIALGGSRNEAIVEKDVACLRNHAQEFLRVINQYRNTDDLERRKAIELIRSDAVCICGCSRLVNKTSDGTILFTPKKTRMAYNCTVLNRYERMVANIEWLRSTLPPEGAP